jgi:hypothetical protein
MAQLSYIEMDLEYFMYYLAVTANQFDDRGYTKLYGLYNAVSTPQMLGQCDQCGLTNVEVKPTKIENNKTRTLCNQCRPADGAYAY